MSFVLLAGVSWWSLALAIVLGLGLGWIMVRNQNKDYSKISVLSREDFIQNMRKGQLIDIRKKADYDEDKIKGARNFKIRALTGKATKLRRDQAIYVYCQNGRKSKSAAKKLIGKNYNTVYVLDGGLDAYNKK
jgi:rhodanese-related sulfurtransferase